MLNKFNDVKDHGEYTKFRCPKCGKLEAFYYKDSSFAYCSHKGACGWKENVNTDAGKKSGEQEYFDSHCIDPHSLPVSRIVSAANWTIKLREGNLIRLVWSEEKNKFMWMLPTGWKAEQGDILPPQMVGKKALYVMAGISDWLKATQDGLAAISSLFGESYIPKDMKIFTQYERVMIVYDTDSAGRKGARKLYEALKEASVNCYVIDLPNFQTSKDYCDFRAENSLESFLSLRGRKILPTSDMNNFALTNLGNAEFLAFLSGQDFRFISDLGKWVKWNSHHWSFDNDEKILRACVDMARIRLDQAVALEAKTKEESAHRESMIKFARGCESKKSIDATSSIASFIHPFFIQSSEFDSNPDLIGVRNGVVNLRTGEKREGKREDYILNKSHVTFKESDDCPLWKEKVKEIFGGDENLINFFHKAIGYSSSGNMTEQIFFICWGSGRNGKSLLLNTIKDVIGDYAANTPFSTFEQSKKQDVGNDIASLMGKRFVIASETDEAKYINEARIKAITGQDPITCRFLYKEFFTFFPQFKIWLITNEKPKIRSQTASLWARLRLIPFTLSFVGKEDRTLAKRLMEEASGILNWIVEGYQMYLEEGLEPPQIMIDCGNEYRTENDPFGAFLDEECFIDSTVSIPASKLFEAYAEWAKARHEYQHTFTKFGWMMKEKGFEKIRSGFGIKYIGIALKEKESTDG